ncbi:MAG: dUTP diphosphatase [Nanoarchaeota archaeon]|nr:dUTP diphosphatase [Nanoarchaeota archaeon]
MPIEIKVKKIHPDARVPVYGSEEAAGLDLFSNESYELKTGETYVFKTGIQMEIPKGYAGLMWDRSGLSSKHSIERVAGVIDSDYRGEIGIALHNQSGKNYMVNKGDKIAQLLIQRVERVSINTVENLSDSVRGEGGFGSTGK